MHMDGMGYSSLHPSNLITPFASFLFSSRSGNAELAVLLDPGVPLKTALGGGVRGPDGQELTPPAMFLCPITQVGARAQSHHDLRYGLSLAFAAA
jgi:hypothetical protein